MNIMNQNFYSKKGGLRKSIIAGVAFSMLLASSTAPSVANDPIGGFIHTIQCAGLLVSNPERHLIECGVGEMDNTPLAKTGTGVGQDNPPPPLSEEESCTGENCVET